MTEVWCRLGVKVDFTADEMEKIKQGQEIDLKAALERGATLNPQEDHYIPESIGEWNEMDVHSSGGSFSLMPEGGARQDNASLEGTERNEGTSQDLAGPLIGDTLPRLVDWLRDKVEGDRIDFENDAPYLEGMLEDIEACIEANNTSSPKDSSRSNTVKTYQLTIDENPDYVYLLRSTLEKSQLPEPLEIIKRLEIFDEWSMQDFADKDMRIDKQEGDGVVFNIDPYFPEQHDFEGNVADSMSIEMLEKIAAVVDGEVCPPGTTRQPFIFKNLETGIVFKELETTGFLCISDEYAKSYDTHLDHSNEDPSLVFDLELTGGVCVNEAMSSGLFYETENYDEVERLVKKTLAVKLWEKLEQIPKHDNGELKDSFLEVGSGAPRWPAGTNQAEVWDWLEKEFDVQIRELSDSDIFNPERPDDGPRM